MFVDIAEEMSQSSPQRSNAITIDASTAKAICINFNRWKLHIKDCFLNKCSVRVSSIESQQNALPNLEDILFALQS